MLDYVSNSPINAAESLFEQANIYLASMNSFGKSVVMAPPNSGASLRYFDCGTAPFPSIVYLLLIMMPDL